MGSLRFSAFVVKTSIPVRKTYINSHTASCFFSYPQFPSINSSSFRQIGSFPVAYSENDKRLLGGTYSGFGSSQLMVSSTFNIDARTFSCGSKSNMKISNVVQSSEGMGLNKPGAGPNEGSSSSSPSPNEGLSKREKLKIAIRDYGATVLVFHVTMSLASLGLCYVLVSSGLDVVGILEKIGIGESIAQSKVTAGAGIFVVAYAVHKVFAPVRITITLTATPLIVRKLRGMGILKQPKAALKTSSEK